MRAIAHYTVPAYRAQASCPAWACGASDLCLKKLSQFVQHAASTALFPSSDSGQLRMKPAQRWRVAVGALAGLLALVALAAFMVMRWVPSDAQLAKRAAQVLQTRLGVGVTVGAMHWRLLPWPVVVLEDLATVQTQSVTLKTLTLYPNIAALWQRRLQLDHAEVEGAVVPQLSLHAMGQTHTDASAPLSGTVSVAAAAPLGDFVLDEQPLLRLVFRDVTWITRRGIPVVYSGEADFDPHWRPRTAVVRRPDTTPATDLLLTRLEGLDAWRARINLGGGTAHGAVQLHTTADGQLRLTGQLQPQGVELASALSAFNRRPMISGTVAGSTTLAASGATPADLAQSLHTRTTFAVNHGVLLRFDVGKAVRTLGKDHSGQTPLDAITGQMDTQNSALGMAVRFTDIHARSGALSASGSGSLANQQVEAELAVDVVDGLVGVPLKITGPTQHVSVTVPTSAVIGSAVGTAVLPGVGTLLGARVGAALGKLFP